MVLKRAENLPVMLRNHSLTWKTITQTFTSLLHWQDSEREMIRDERFRVWRSVIVAPPFSFSPYYILTLHDEFWNKTLLKWTLDIISV